MVLREEVSLFVSQMPLSSLASVVKEGDGKVTTPEEPRLAGKRTYDQDTKNTPFGKCHPKAN